MTHGTGDMTTNHYHLNRSRPAKFTIGKYLKHTFWCVIASLNIGLLALLLLLAADIVKI